MAKWSSLPYELKLPILRYVLEYTIRDCRTANRPWEPDQTYIHFQPNSKPEDSMEYMRHLSITGNELEAIVPLFCIDIDTAYHLDKIIPKGAVRIECQYLQNANRLLHSVQQTLRRNVASMHCWTLNRLPARGRLNRMLQLRELAMNLGRSKAWIRFTFEIQPGAFRVPPSDQIGHVAFRRAEDTPSFEDCAAIMHAEGITDVETGTLCALPGTDKVQMALSHGSIWPKDVAAMFDDLIKLTPREYHEKSKDVATRERHLQMDIALREDNQVEPIIIITKSKTTEVIDDWGSDERKPLHVDKEDSFPSLVCKTPVSLPAPSCWTRHASDTGPIVEAAPPTTKTSKGRGKWKKIAW